ncbi:LPXTG cell wall anchor domain-containing protein [Compostimonas suwonensis]|uniref:LPXTG-motif cell wall-anchored protein n=1 Tax=Compostimonas suwonensis TaxID=1048394 RepID=A0A2M9C4M9_9MICO|nr:LPXTG cell wall anchor domain-containing protein [Compostimonas suwonensis]PJJ65490.1 LPXTG-motif cell wall-anchored protein [Compostimonas suwonensis]
MNDNRPRPRLRRAVLATATAAALALSTLVASPAAPAFADDPAGTAVSDAVFRWGLSNEANNKAFAPGTSNFFSAGKAPKTSGADTISESEWAATSGDVTIEKQQADGSYATATWAGLKTTPAGGTIPSPTSGQFSNHRVVIGDGTGDADADADSADIQWTGDFTVAFYSGMTQFYVSDPHLIVSNGSGELTATLSGFGTSMDDPDVFQPLPTAEVTLAVLNGVDVTDDGFEVSPDYLGVEVELPASASPQVRTGDNWGSFPQSMVDYQLLTGQSSYWYSSGLSTDAFKVPLPISVGFELAPAPVAPSITAQPASTTVVAGETASFQVTADGGEPLSYIWERSDDGSSWSPIDGATTAGYELVATSDDDGARFRVVVSGPGGSVTSDAASLTVTPPAPQTVEVDGAQLEWAYSRYAQYGVFGAWSMTASGDDVSTSTLNGKTVSGLDADLIKNFNLVRFEDGQGALDAQTGAGTITWDETGDWVLNAYNGQYGAPDETLRDPVLTIEDDATGSLSFEAYIPAGLDMSGAPAPAAGPTRIVLATFSSVTVDDGVITAVPEYAGRSYTPVGGSPWQACDGAGGSWPSAWIDFVPTSVQAHYYTTSCSGLNLMKPPLPVTVRLDEVDATITSQPVAASVDAGQTAGFTVVAAGNPVHYQWQRSTDGESWNDIPDATDSKLALTAGIDDDGTRVRVLVNGSLESDVVTLTVATQAPAIVGSGQDLVVLEGAPRAAFRANASGIPAPVATWQTSADGGDTWTAVSEGVSGSTYSIEHPRLDQSGLLVRAVFENGVGDAVTSEPRSLTVLPVDGKTVAWVLGAPVDPTQLGSTYSLRASFAGFTVPEGSTTDIQAALVPESALEGTNTPDPSTFVWSETLYASNLLEYGGHQSDQLVSLYPGLIDPSVRYYLVTFSTDLADRGYDTRTLLPIDGQSVPTPITEASFEWAINNQHQGGAQFGGCDYFVAGKSDGTASSYLTRSGDVSILKRTADGSFVAVGEGNRCLPLGEGGSNGQRILFTSGDGERDPQTGAVEIQWHGAATVNAYGGLVPWYVEDPKLTLDAQGDGTVVARVGGFRSSMADPNVKEPLPPTEGVVIATVSGADVSDDGGFTVTPVFRGVDYFPLNNPLDPSSGRQTTSAITADVKAGNPDWGSWPEPFVDFQYATGLSSYWHTSGGVADPKKPPLPFTVDYDFELPETDPVLVRNPASLTVSEGADVQFTALGGGNPAPNGIQWQEQGATAEDWTDLEGETSETLSIPDVTVAAHNGLVVRAVVTSPRGTVVSAPATLTVEALVAPVIQTQPQSVTVRAGGTASFQVQATGSTLAYQWQRSTDDGASWTPAGSTTSSLSVGAGVAQDGDLFRVVVSNGVSEPVVSEVATLTVTVEAPAITQQPRDARIFATQSVIIGVTGTGAPAPSWQWQKSTDGGASWTDFGTPYPSVAIVGVLEEDGALYRAVGSNGIGEPVVTDAVTIDVVAVDGRRVLLDPNTPIDPAAPLSATLRGGGFTVPDDFTGRMRTVLVEAGTWSPGSQVAVEDRISTVLRTGASLRSGGGYWTSPLTLPAGTLDPNTAYEIVTYRDDVLEDRSLDSVTPIYLVGQEPGRTPLSGATVEFGFNNVHQGASPAGGCNYFVAGTVQGLGGDYQSVDGNVYVVKKTAEGGNEVVGVSTRCTPATEGSTSIDQRFLFTEGTGYTSENGETSIQWTGAGTINAYGGLVSWYFENPLLVLDENGDGSITANVGGFGSSMDNPDVKIPLEPRQGVEIATVRGASIVDGALTIDPVYKGVDYFPLANPLDPQSERSTTSAIPAAAKASNPDWGSWPQSFVDFQYATGLSSYWHTSGLTADPNKPPLPIEVDLEGSAPEFGPLFVQEPGPVDVREGTDAVFTARAVASSGEVAVQWQAKKAGGDWTDLDGETSSTLTLAAVTVAEWNGAAVRAVGTLGDETVTTAAAAIRVTLAAAPVFTKQPESVTTGAGWYVGFQSAASGYPAPAYQWQRKAADGTWADVAGATSANYSFNSAYPADDGAAFRVIASNSEGQAVSEEVTLALTTSPVVIDAQPQDNVAFEGGTSYILVSADGAPYPTASWERSRDGETWEALPGQGTGGALEFSGLTLADSGYRYRAILDNGIGEPVVSESATLTVLPTQDPPVHLWSDSEILDPAAAHRIDVVFGKVPDFPAGSDKLLTWGIVEKSVWQPGDAAVPREQLIGGSLAQGDFSYYHTWVQLSAGALDPSKEYGFAVFASPRNGSEPTHDFDMYVPITVGQPAAITQQPASATVELGDAATFTVAASGRPDPGYQWQLKSGDEWTDIEGATAASYSPAAGLEANGSIYRVVVSNGIGEAVVSDEATLTVNRPTPTVTVSKTTGLDPDGETVTVTGTGFLADPPTTTAARPPLAGRFGGVYVVFGKFADSWQPTVTTTGRNIIDQKWAVLADDVQTIGGTAAGAVELKADGSFETTLTVKSGQFDKTGDYGVYTYGGGGVKYAPFETKTAVTLAEAPAAVVTQPRSLVAPVAPASGDPVASFTVAASGAPAPTVQWQKRAGDGAWAPIDGATSATLDYPYTAADGGAQFRAVVSNGIATANSDAATLTVGVPAGITAQPTPASVEPGTTARFTVAVAGDPAPGIQWQRKPVGGDWTTIVGATAATLEVEATTELDGVQYRVVVGNDIPVAVGGADGSTVTSEAVALTVLYQPIAITAQPQSLVAPVAPVNGEPVASFEVAADGTPEVGYQWQRRAAGSSLWEDVAGATGAVLAYGYTADDDGAAFRAVVSNRLGESAVSHEAQLTVGVPVAIVSQPGSQTAVDGTPATFEVEVGGTAPAIQWETKAPGQDGFVAIEGATDAALTVPAAPAASGTEYRAVVTGPVGGDIRPAGSSEAGSVATSDTAVLTVPEPAEAPTPVADDELTETARGGVEIVEIDGGRVTLDVGADRAGHYAGVWVHSTPVFLGWHLVPASGLVTVTLPSGLAAGEHKLVVVDASGNLVGWSPIVITVDDDGLPVVAPAAPAAPAASAALPATGADAAPWLALALLLLLAGATIVAGQRRQSRWGSRLTSPRR